MFVDPSNLQKQLEGYQLAYGQKTNRDRVGCISIQVFVKMNRPFDREVDWIGGHVGDIDKMLWRNTVLKDPNTEARANEMEQRFRELFEEPIFIKQIPNQYCSDPCCYDRPWFEVTTRIGKFTLGWRKSVISIDWDETIIAQSAEDLFPDEEVTKDGFLIHAWSYEKAKEYIAKIHQAGAKP